MAAVTICSDFGIPPKYSLTLFPPLFAMKWWDWLPWSSFSECWDLSQLFHSPFSLSSGGSLVHLCIWGYWYFSQQSWLIGYFSCYGFSSGHVWMWELDCEESWVPKNWCFWTVLLEKTLETPLDCKEIQPVHPKGDQFLGVHWKDWCWSWNSNTLATWCKELTHLKIPWCWERLRVGREGDDRGWDGWMASLTQ